MESTMKYRTGFVISLMLMVSAISPGTEALPTSVLANSKALTSEHIVADTAHTQIGSAAGAALATNKATVFEPPAPVATGISTTSLGKSASPSAMGDAEIGSVRPALQKRAVNSPTDWYQSVGNSFPAVGSGVWSDDGQKTSVNAYMYPPMTNDDDDQFVGNYGNNADGENSENNDTDDSDGDDKSGMSPYEYRQQSEESAANAAAAAAILSKRRRQIMYEQQQQQRQQLDRPTAYEHLQNMLMDADVLRGVQQRDPEYMLAEPQMATDQYNPYYDYETEAALQQRRRKRSSIASMTKRLVHSSPSKATELLQLLALTEAVQQQQHPTPIATGLSPYTEDLVMMLNPQQHSNAGFETQLLQQQPRNYFNGRDDANDMVQQPGYYVSRQRGEYDNNDDLGGMIDAAARQLQLRNILEQRNRNIDANEMADALPKWLPESVAIGQHVRSKAASKGHKEQMPEQLGNGRY